MSLDNRETIVLYWNCKRGSYTHVQFLISIYVTRFYKTNSNHTAGKITPVDSYTIVLIVLTLTTTQTAGGWFQQMSFLGGV